MNASMISLFLLSLQSHVFIALEVYVFTPMTLAAILDDTYRSTDTQRGNILQLRLPQGERIIERIR